ncbi:hypothetical protein CHS0354_007911 [Potamilus streckersoni]|uniref:Uncharacterized protein n=1 Tax=Potamilus streckersoni TaxID=2493646 RepID=A0AAE0S8X2_9BIVA|nr:hypothetical protein CHS0354_007911 [Potamilus streckersoni]
MKEIKETKITTQTMEITQTDIIGENKDLFQMIESQPNDRITTNQQPSVLKYWRFVPETVLDATLVDNYEDEAIVKKPLTLYSSRNSKMFIITSKGFLDF